MMDAQSSNDWGGCEQDEVDRRGVTETDRVIRALMNRRVMNAVPMATWPDRVRGVPNVLLRSGLFAATKRGVRPFLRVAPVTTLKNAQIRMTGERLDQSDLDVWLGVLHLARGLPLNQPIEFTERGLLRSLGRGGVQGESLGTSDRLWLRRTLARLTMAELDVKVGLIEFKGPLVASSWRDQSKCLSQIWLDPRLILLFGRDGWTGVDWPIRCALRGHPLALWLHAFFSTHARPHPLKIQTLHALCGSDVVVKPGHAGGLDNWRDKTLRPALAAVQRASLAHEHDFEWRIDANGCVAVERTTSVSQARHLRRLANKLELFTGGTESD